MIKPNVNKIVGVKDAVSELRRQGELTGDRVAKGLKAAGLMLQNLSQALVPFEFGLLHGSAFTRAEGEGFKTVVQTGYTAAYAGPVHRKVEMKLKGQKRRGKGHKGKYWDPQGRAIALFLETPMRENMHALGEVVRTIAWLGGKKP